MTLFDKPKQIALILKHFLFAGERCSRCLYRAIDPDNCEFCAGNENYDEEDCQLFHESQLCSFCYYIENDKDQHSKKRVIYLILKHILSLENYEEAFLEAYEAFLNTSNIQTILNALLIKELKHQRYDRVDFLLGRGANINYRFNPNMTLPVYLRFRSMRELKKRSYDFTVVDTYGRSALDVVISRYISMRDEANYFNYIKIMVDIVGWQTFHIKSIAGLEYGDRTHDNSHHNNHYWRRRRITNLINLGMPYDLEEIVPMRKRKKLRHTRLGYYLTWRKILLCLHRT